MKEGDSISIGTYTVTISRTVGLHFDMYENAKYFLRCRTYFVIENITHRISDISIGSLVKIINLDKYVKNL